MVLLAGIVLAQLATLAAAEFFRTTVPDELTELMRATDYNPHASPTQELGTLRSIDRQITVDY